MYLCYLVAHKRHALCHDQCVFGQELEEGNKSPFGGWGAHNGHHLYFPLTQLVLYIKQTDAVHLVAKEVDAIGHFGREGIYIHDASPDGKLSWLIHIVCPFKSQIEDALLQVIDIEKVAHLHTQRILIQLLFRHHTFGKGIWVSNDES